MLPHLRWLAVAVLATGLTAYASADNPKTGKNGFGEPTCNGDHGTSIKFEKTPTLAAKRALKEEKLVLVIHISGYFEEPDYT
jgi:hypothetical protein